MLDTLAGMVSVLIVLVGSFAFYWLAVWLMKRDEEHPLQRRDHPSDQ